MRHKLSRSSRYSRIRGQLMSRLGASVLLIALIAALGFAIDRWAFVPEEAQPSIPASVQPQNTPVAEKKEETLETDASLSEASRIYGFQSAVIDSNGILEYYERTPKVSFGLPDTYSAVRGITTYGGNNFRNSFVYGTQSVNEKTLTRAWERGVGSLTTAGGDTWQGTGWTGMPLIIQWEKEVRQTLGVKQSFKKKNNFTEVIYPANDGKIYFYELESGLQTRDPINIGAVLKGTATLDPRGYPVLYVGQGVEDEKDGRGAWLRAISLIDNTVIWRAGGTDRQAFRNYQAYDGSALIDAKSDTLFYPGENGILYSTVLHTAFDAAAGTLSIQPEGLVKYRYTADGYGADADMKKWGVESSPAAYGQNAFFTDNGGFLQCVDLNHMRLVYAVDLLNESDATPVIAVEEDGVSIYTASMAGADSNGYLRKHDAKTGNILWTAACPTVDTGDASDTRGALGTPHAGHGNINDLVIFNCTMVPHTGETKTGGCVIALDKASGRERWRYSQEGGCWSSPVVIYDAAQNAYVLQCDRTGWLQLLDAVTGKLLFSLDLGSRIESTPAVFENYLVVGTKGQYGSWENAKILCVKIS